MPRVDAGTLYYVPCPGKAGPRMLIARETIPVERYNQLRALGFPEDILPIPLDIPRGPRPKEPRFPGLMEPHQEASHVS